MMTRGTEVKNWEGPSTNRTGLEDLGFCFDEGGCDSFCVDIVICEGKVR